MRALKRIIVTIFMAFILVGVFLSSGSANNPFSSFDDFNKFISDYKKEGLPGSLELFVGETDEWSVFGQYTILSKDFGVAAASIPGQFPIPTGPPYKLIFTGKKAGVTEIIFTDENDKETVVQVTVKIESIDISLDAGTIVDQKMSVFSYDHTADVVDDEIATAETIPVIVNGGGVTITGLWPGKTQITVRDAKGVVSGVINVTVTGTVTEPAQNNLSINDDYSFFADVKFDFLGIIQIMRAQFEFIGEQNGKMLWKLAGPPMKKTTETGDEVELGMDYSFEIPYAESSYGNFKLKFKFIGEQNGNYLWELVYLESI